MRLLGYLVALPLIAATAATATMTTANSSVAQQQQPQVPAVAASSFATTEIRFIGRYVYGQWFPGATGLEGPARMSISYGQPHARGRQIPGTVIPLDSVWRLGANNATELRTEVDLTIGGVSVPHGVYSLWVQPSATADWQLIVNKEVGQFGTGADYTAGADFARIPLRKRQLTDPVESLSIYLIPTVAAQGAPAAKPKGQLRIVWGTMELTTDWAMADWKKPTR